MFTAIIVLPCHEVDICAWYFKSEVLIQWLGYDDVIYLNCKVLFNLTAVESQIGIILTSDLLLNLKCWISRIFLLSVVCCCIYRFIVTGTVSVFLPIVGLVNVSFWQLPLKYWLVVSKIVFIWPYWIVCYDKFSYCIVIIWFII